MPHGSVITGGLLQPARSVAVTRKRGPIPSPCTRTASFIAVPHVPTYLMNCIGCYKVSAQTPHPNAFLECERLLLHKPFMQEQSPAFQKRRSRSRFWTPKSAQGRAVTFTSELFADKEIPPAVGECRRQARRACMGKGKSLACCLYDWGHARWPGMLDCRPIALHAWLEQAGFVLHVAETRQLRGLLVEIVLGVGRRQAAFWRYKLASGTASIASSRSCRPRKSATALTCGAGSRIRAL